MHLPCYEPTIHRFAAPRNTPWTAKRKPKYVLGLSAHCPSIRSGCRPRSASAVARSTGLDGLGANCGRTSSSVRRGPSATAKRCCRRALGHQDDPRHLHPCHGRDAGRCHGGASERPRIVYCCQEAPEASPGPPSFLVFCRKFKEWRDPDSNRGHHDFQSEADVRVCPSMCLG
jgi:hypothetical protein